jgi:hypothetical protein
LYPDGTEELGSLIDRTTVGVPLVTGGTSAVGALGPDDPDGDPLVPPDAAGEEFTAFGVAPLWRLPRMVAATTTAATTITARMPRRIFFPAPPLRGGWPPLPAGYWLL